MFFSENHKKGFMEMEKKRFGKSGNFVDPEYNVAFYLMSFVSTTKTLPYVTRGGIKFDEMLEKEYFSTGQEFLIKVAKNLFRSSGEIDLSDMLYISGDFYIAFENALKIRRGADLE